MAKEPAKPAPAPGADILKLLTKAQTEFVTVSFYLMHLCIADCDVCFWGLAARHRHQEIFIALSFDIFVVNW